MFAHWLARARRVAVASAAALALLLMADVGSAFAQQGAIAGRVVDASNLEPINGAQVFVPDTDVGTLTNEDGRYRLTGIPAGQVTIRVRILGYRTATRSVTVRAGETSTVNFELRVSAVSLEEVVVTATGEQRSREIGNAISTIDAAGTVEKTQNSQLSGLLQGQSTGVQVLRSSGSVGSASSIKIRGNSSISLDNTPIIYVDGARIDNTNSLGSGQSGQEFSRLNDLNPEDIESIEVVKGPAAATLYGTEAAAGVIRITTKGGTSGQTTWTLKGEYGGNWDDSAWPNSYWHPDSFGLGAAAIPGVGADTLWSINMLDDQEPFVTGDIETIGGTARGGIEWMTYYVSAQRRQEGGNLPNNTVDRYNVRANFSLNPSEKVDLSVNNGFTSNFTTLPDNDNNGFGYIGVAQIAFPWAFPQEVNGVTTCPLAAEFARINGLPLNQFPVGGPTANALGCQTSKTGFGGRSFRDIQTLQNSNDVERYTGSGTMTYRPFDFWTNRVTVGYDAQSGQRKNIIPVDPAAPFGSLSQGFIFREDRTGVNLTLEANSTLDFDITEDFGSQTTVGAQYFRETTEATQATGDIFPGGAPAVNNSVINSGDDFFAETITAGFFIQEQLSYQDKLFLTPAVRFDDNSAFGENLGLQSYPRISASYSISDEEWFPAFFETMKLRGAWGESGKQPGSNNALALLAVGPTITQGSNELGVSPFRPGNADLKPETGREWELGFDASMLDGRLGLEFTYYDQVTENALVTKPLAPSVGFPGAQWANIAEMTNSGLELGLDAVAVDVPNLSWDWRVNLSTNNNEVTTLNQPIIYGLGGSSQRHTEGHPYGSYFAEPITVPDGCNSTSCAVVGNTQFIGHPTPEWNGSVSSTITLFNNITLYGLLDFSGGQSLLNNTDEFQCGFLGGGEFAGICPDLFFADADGTYSDEAIKAQTASGIRPTSEAPFDLDATYAKLRTVSVQFNLPGEWAQAFGGQSASLSVVGENLATFTGYSGMDPEINWAGGANQSRAEFLTLPPARRVLATMSVTF